MAFFFFAGWLIWWGLRDQLLFMLRYLRLAEMWFVSLFSDQQNACYEWLKQAPIENVIPTPDNVNKAGACFGFANLGLPGINPLDFYHLTGISMGVMGHRMAWYLHVPLLVFFICVGLYAIFISPRSKFKTRHTLESFIKIQARMWPVITPIVNFKPASLSARIPGSRLPDKLAPFAEALSPEEWIAYNRIAVTNGIPDREAARRAYILQLGPRWSGIENQHPYMHALFAAYALKGVQKREEADELLGRLATCWTINGGFRMTPEIAAEVKRIVRDPAIGGEAAKIASQYAYRTTAMLGTLKWARMMGGVLASAQFLWVRAVDRQLWYPLNNLGRRSYHAEGSGAIAHFMAEESAKKPLPIPRVDTAIMALNQFLADAEKHPMAIPSREEPAET